MAKKCSAIKTDGSPCGAWAMPETGLCPGHGGVIGGKVNENVSHQVGAGLGAGSDGRGNGLGTGVSQADEALALGSLRRILKARKADAATVSAARELLAQSGSLTPPKPRSVRQIEAMSTDDLVALLRSFEREGLITDGLLGDSQAV